MSELGLFPLGIVLLPTEQIPLHIFEERYQELIGECLDLELEFGLVYADDEGLREVGTRALVTEVLDRFDDGRLNIVVEGGERFRLLQLTEGR
jgi:Lon protease-like protein